MTSTLTAIQGSLDLALIDLGRDRCTVPAEVIERDEEGRAWLKLGNEWRRLAGIENLWELAPTHGRAQPGVGLHFRAVTEDGRTVRLVQDLCQGEWFRELTPAVSTP